MTGIFCANAGGDGFERVQHLTLSGRVREADGCCPGSSSLSCCSSKPLMLLCSFVTVLNWGNL